MRKSARAYGLPDDATVQDILNEQERRRREGGDGSPVFNPKRQDTRSPAELADEMSAALRADLQREKESEAQQ